MWCCSTTPRPGQVLSSLRSPIRRRAGCRRRYVVLVSVVRRKGGSRRHRGCRLGASAPSSAECDVVCCSTTPLPGQVCPDRGRRLGVALVAEGAMWCWPAASAHSQVSSSPWLSAGRQRAGIARCDVVLINAISLGGRSRSHRGRRLGVRALGSAGCDVMVVSARRRRRGLSLTVVPPSHPHVGLRPSTTRSRSTSSGRRHRHGLLSRRLRGC